MASNKAVRPDDKRLFKNHTGNLGLLAMPAPVIERLIRHTVGYSGSGCWEWIGETDRSGYGRMQFKKDGRKKSRFVHRVAYKHFHPDWDERAHVLHKCDNPPCWNPDHLFLGDQEANMHDMKAKGRANNGDTRGEKNGRAKLTWDQVREMRAMFEKGFSRSHICEKFNTPRWNLGYILRNQSWRE